MEITMPQWAYDNSAEAQEDSNSTPEPEEDEEDSNKRLLFCPKCEGIRLEIMWYRIDKQYFLMRCLSCGTFQNLNHELNMVHDPKRKIKSKEVSYLG